MITVFLQYHAEKLMLLTGSLIVDIILKKQQKSTLPMADNFVLILKIHIE